MTLPVLVAVETGGTKIVCRVVGADGATARQFQLATGDPIEAIKALAAGVAEAAPGARVVGVGVAAFGPVDVDPTSATYGRVLETPKPGWAHFDLGTSLSRAFDAPLEIDTDVNAAALAEQAIGAGRGLKAVAYVTVGTGIGGGLAIDGASLRGGLHPEIGHLPVRRAESDELVSVCGFHTACVEGLAAGPAVRARLAGRELGEAPEVCDLLAGYLGQLCAQLVLAWSPQRIVMGGGVLSDPSILPRIEARARAELNGYGAARVMGASGYLVPAALEHAGLEGAVMLAQRAAGQERWPKR